MRTARISKLLCSLILVAIPAGAQSTSVDSTAGTQDDTAVSLLKASLTAMIASATATPTTLTESGTITPLDTDVAPYVVRIYVQSTDKFRWEKDLPNGTTATVVNGSAAQAQTSSTSSPLLPWQVGARKLENFPILLLSHWLNAKTIQARFVGVETIDGQALNHISVVDYSQRMGPPNPWRRNNQRGEYELYLASATSLPVRLHYYQETDDRYLLSLAPMVIVYSDFRVVAGSMFPFTLTRYVNQTKLSVLQLQSVVPGVAVSVNAFQIN